MTIDEIKKMVVQLSGCDMPEDDSPALKMFIDFANMVADYVAPQRTWIGLTDDDWNSTPYDTEFRAGAEWAEDKLKEKNI